MSVPVTVVDISDVEKAILGLLNTAIFGCNTVVNPAVLTSTTIKSTVIPIRIYRGWPNDDRLQTDIKAGGTNISIYQMAVGRNTSRFLRDPVLSSKAPLTASLSVTGASVTVSGTGSASNVIGVAYGPLSGTYRPANGESSASMASNLANAVPNATVIGNTITVPTNGPIIARVGGDVTSLMETARQSQRFLISIWAPSSAIRDLVGTVVHGAMSRAINLPLPYGVTTEALISRNSSNPQMDEKVGVFRRDEPWEMAFPTVDLIIDPPVVFIKPSVNTVPATVE